MKKNISYFTRYIKLYQFPLVIFAFIYSGCASKIVAVRMSPVRYGYGVQLDPGWQIGQSKSSVHVLAAYARSEFKGGGGHYNYWQFGGQFRHSLSKDENAGFWIGAELAYLGIANIYTDNSPKITASGFTIGPMAGYKFKIGKLPLSVFIIPELLSRGKYRSAGVTTGTSATGFYGQIGIDLHLLSLLHKKGR